VMWRIDAEESSVAVDSSHRRRRCGFSPLVGEVKVSHFVIAPAADLPFAFVGSAAPSSSTGDARSDSGLIRLESLLPSVSTGRIDPNLGRDACLRL
jgi:hypothetical protein